MKSRGNERDVARGALATLVDSRGHNKLAMKQCLMGEASASKWFALVKLLTVIVVRRRCCATQPIASPRISASDAELGETHQPDEIKVKEKEEKGRIDFKEIFAQRWPEIY